MKGGKKNGQLWKSESQYNFKIIIMAIYIIIYMIIFIGNLVILLNIEQM